MGQARSGGDQGPNRLEPCGGSVLYMRCMYVIAVMALEATWQMAMKQHK